MDNQLPEYSVVFLGDELPPTSVVLLQRAPTKTFAPNMYTGIGGHREEFDKDIMETFRRELEEETGIKDIELTEFARLVVRENDERILYYAFGQYDHKRALPKCNEGTLEWVETDNLLNKPVIPTTAAVINEWSNRYFAIDKPFTLTMHQKNQGPILELIAGNPFLTEGLN